MVRRTISSQWNIFVIIILQKQLCFKEQRNLGRVTNFWFDHRSLVWKRCQLHQESKPKPGSLQEPTMLQEIWFFDFFKAIHHGIFEVKVISSNGNLYGAALFSSASVSAARGALGPVSTNVSPVTLNLKVLISFLVLSSVLHYSPDLFARVHKEVMCLLLPLWQVFPHPHWLCLIIPESGWWGLSSSGIRFSQVFRYFFQ